MHRKYHKHIMHRNYKMNKGRSICFNFVNFLRRCEVNVDLRFLWYPNVRHTSNLIEVPFFFCTWSIIGTASSIDMLILSKQAEAAMVQELKRLNVSAIVPQDL